MGHSQRAVQRTLWSFSVTAVPHCTAEVGTRVRTQASKALARPFAGRVCSEPYKESCQAGPTTTSCCTDRSSAHLFSLQRLPKWAQTLNVGSCSSLRSVRTPSQRLLAVLQSRCLQTDSMLQGAHINPCNSRCFSLLSLSWV